MAGSDVLLVAGEASGDLHAARLLSELRRLVPGLRPFGLGGDELESSGLEILAHAAEISVVGITEALKVLPRARRIFSHLLAEVDRRGARGAILVDFPEFNLRLARALHERGVTVLYYISPQVWAWRRRRVNLISRVVDRMLVVFPFEVDFYRRYGVEAVHVGHPLVDEVPSLVHVWDAGAEGYPPYRIALLPGSRDSEVDTLLPVLLETARVLSRRLPVRFSLIKASTISGEKLRTEIARHEVDVKIVDQDRYQAMASSHLALCAAGTATLEVGLVGTPMIVVYRVGGWSFLVGRLMVRLPHASIVNLLLEEEAVPELLQHDCDPDKIAAKALELLSTGSEIDLMRSRLAGLRQRVGATGASRRAAQEVMSCLKLERSVA